MTDAAQRRKKASRPGGTKKLRLFLRWQKDSFGRVICDQFDLRRRNFVADMVRRRPAAELTGEASAVNLVSSQGVPQCSLTFDKSSVAVPVPWHPGLGVTV